MEVVVRHCEPSVLALVSGLNKELYNLRIDVEILSSILHRFGIHKKVTSFKELLVIMDSVLFSPSFAFSLSSEYRRLRWKYATNNQPFTALCKSVMIKDIETMKHILSDEYISNDIPFSGVSPLLTYATIFNFDLDDFGIEGMFGYNTQHTIKLLIECIHNKDFVTFKDVIERVRDYDDIPGLIANVIIFSDDLDLYLQPELLGLDIEDTPSRKLLEEPGFLNQSAGISILNYCIQNQLLSIDNKTIITISSPSMFFWKLQYLDEENFSQAYFFFNLRYANESVEDYIRMIKKLSEIKKDDELATFSFLLSQLEFYVRRELIKHYFERIKSDAKVYEKIFPLINRNEYGDKEYNILLQRLTERS